jgi:hypothetical protein
MARDREGKDEKPIAEKLEAAALTGSQVDAHLNISYTLSGSHGTVSVTGVHNMCI